MTDDFVVWLKSKLDERERQLADDERLALAATAAPWMAKRADRSVYAQETSIVMGGHDGSRYVVPHDGETREGIEPGDAEHIARHDPARVLARVECGRRDNAGKRALLGRYEDALARQQDWDHSQVAADVCVAEYEDWIVPRLAQEFDGEPGWREEWAWTR